MPQHSLDSRSCRWRLVLAVLACVASAGAAARVVTGEPAPDFVLKSVAGANVRLSEFRGEVVLVTFWASWCGKCGEQLAALAGLRERYGSGVRVLGVALDEQAERARRAVGPLPAEAVLVDAAKAVAREYDPRKLPLTVLLDPTGRVRYVHEGYTDGDGGDYARELDQLLAE